MFYFKQLSQSNNAIYNDCIYSYLYLLFQYYFNIISISVQILLVKSFNIQEKLPDTNYKTSTVVVSVLLSVFAQKPNTCRKFNKKNI